MKRIITAMLIGLSALGMTMQYSHKVSAELQNQVYRLHVIANSDSQQDQELKLKVRDRVIKTLDDLVGGGASLEETKKAVYDNMELICEAASEEIRENGFEYPVTVKTGSFPFPTKYYGNVGLPKGKYDGLQVVIGEGAGQNWWCVLYPNLCFVDGTVSMPKDSQNKLKNSLSGEAADIISGQGSGGIKIKFKILELFD